MSIQHCASHKWAGIILKYSTALWISEQPFPRERSLMYAFRTSHLPRAFLTCLEFLTLVDWWRNSFWQDNTEVTERFEKKHSVPVGRSCFMTLHPYGPSPPRSSSPTMSHHRIIQWKITPAESWVMLSVDPTPPVLPPIQRYILLQLLFLSPPPI